MRYKKITVDDKYYHIYEELTQIYKDFRDFGDFMNEHHNHPNNCSTQNCKVCDYKWDTMAALSRLLENVKEEIKQFYFEQFMNLQ